jgi:Acetyltransferase (GNAT) family.
MIYVDEIRPEDYIRLRQAVGWKGISREQAEKGLQHTAKICGAVENGITIAMSRMLFDYGYTAYIADVIVDPAYQGRGIGAHMIHTLLSWLKNETASYPFIQINLCAAKGKEPFYEKLGFEVRPSDTNGAGMILRWENGTGNDDV